MISIHRALRTAIRERLLPYWSAVYSGQVPASEQGTYILLSDVDTTDESTMSTQDISVNVQIGIYGKQNLAPNSDEVEDIARDVLSELYPDPAAVVEVDGYQCTGMSLVSSTEQTLNLNSSQISNRFITFNFKYYYHG